MFCGSSEPGINPCYPKLDPFQQELLIITATCGPIDLISWHRLQHKLAKNFQMVKQNAKSIQTDETLLDTDAMLAYPIIIRMLTFTLPPLFISWACVSCKLDNQLHITLKS